MNVHDAAFDFLPDAIGKIAVGIFKSLRNSEMLFERDLALHGPSLVAPSTLELCHILSHAPVRCDGSRSAMQPLYCRYIIDREDESDVPSSRDKGDQQCPLRP